jgi:hypothetical protein
MKDYLQDMIAHTSALGFIDLIKVTGTDQETKINASSEKQTVMITGIFKNASPDFIGTFGMPNLGKLKTILSFDEYGDDSVITINKTNTTDPMQPTVIHFETKDKSFSNDYRLMGKEIADDQVKMFAYKGKDWAVEFVPSVESILRLKKQSQVHSEEETFATRTANGNLYFDFGDVSTHNGNFVFQAGVTGTLSKKLKWPVTHVISILNLPGDKVFRINGVGALEITVDSGLANYSYLLPAHMK